MRNKKKLIVLVETVRQYLPRLKNILMLANDLGLETLAIIPNDSSSEFTANVPYRTLLTHDFSFEALDTCIHSHSKHFEIVGIAAPMGYFTRGCKTLPAASVAKCAQKYRCPSNTEFGLYCSHNKYLMRRQLELRNLNQINYSMIKNNVDCLKIEKTLSFPIITKPAAGLASGFVRLNHNIYDLIESYEHYKKFVKESFCKIDFDYYYNDEYFNNGTELLCEEVIDGNEYTVEILCTEKDIIPVLIHEKFDITQTKNTVLEPLVFAPSISLSEKQKKEICTYSISVCQALKLKNCFCHFELRYSSQGPIVLEVNPRMGGACISENLRAFCDINYPSMFLYQSLKTSVCDTPPYSIKSPQGYYAMTVIYPCEKGVLKEIVGLKEVERISNVKLVNCHYNVGDIINGENEEVFLVDVWFQAKTESEIRMTDKEIRNLIKYRIEN